MGLEAATLLTGSLIAYSATGVTWWLVPVTLLLPDLSALGYLAGTRVGATLYNVAHATPLPGGPHRVWLVGAHTRRTGSRPDLARPHRPRPNPGVRPEYGDHFQHTHLGRLGGHGQQRRRRSRPSRAAG